MLIVYRAWHLVILQPSSLDLLLLLQKDHSFGSITDNASAAAQYYTWNFSKVAFCQYINALLSIYIAGKTSSMPSLSQWLGIGVDQVNPPQAGNHKKRESRTATVAPKASKVNTPAGPSNHSIIRAQAAGQRDIQVREIVLTLIAIGIMK